MINRIWKFLPPGPRATPAPTLPTVRKLAFKGSYKVTSPRPDQGAVLLFRFPAKDAKNLAADDLAWLERDGYALLRPRGGDIWAIKFVDPV
jgi:hypothetical protein